ncbi:MAG: hypothetical protein JW901_08695 [Dehalococcoidia bacterium]|nr:hypothetical protein [Dehalococcoidia bacterium]
MMKTGGTKKVSITLPDDLIEQVRVHIRDGEFSSFCATALRNHLAHYRQLANLAHSFGVWKDENHPDLSSPKEVSGYVRKLRKADNKRQSKLSKK